MPSKVVWTIVAILALVIGAALITYVSLLIERQKKGPPTTFSCSTTLTPSPFPQCQDSSTVRSGIPGPIGSGYLTALRISPTTSGVNVIQSPTNVIGYYYAHPTAYYSGTIYSYPFVLQVNESGSTTIPPFINLAAYTYSLPPREINSTPFEQFIYSSPGFNGYTISLPCASSATMPPFTIVGRDKSNSPYTSGSPTLATMLGSVEPSPGTSEVYIVMNQGQPYVTLIYNVVPGTLVFLPVITTSNYTSLTPSYNIIVGAKTYTVYTFWHDDRCMVWFLELTSTVTQQLTISAGSATLSVAPIAPVTPTQAIIYISMLSNAGPLLSSIIQLLASSLQPSFIQLADIIPTSSNTAMQYTVLPIPGTATVPTPGSSLLWVVPNTCFETAGLAPVSLPGHGYFDFPIGNGIFLTQPFNVAYTTFFTLWPPQKGSISDFTSYTLQGAAVKVVDTSTATSNDLELYDLALAIRILYATPGAQHPTDDMITQCVSTWVQRMGQMGVGSKDFTLFTSNLNPGDSGLLSRMAYILLTFIHLNAVKGNLPSGSSARGYIEGAGPVITMLIEGFLTTASLNSNGLYTPLALLDAYSCTMPVIKTVNVATTTKPLLTSRLGEVLGYLWACDQLSAPQSRIASLARVLFSMVTESTTRLLRGQCTAASALTLAPVMPWTTFLSPTANGFQLDGYTPGGTSPDGAMLQSFVPFTPATHVILRPIFAGLAVSVDKLLKCIQNIPQALPSQYNYVGYVDPVLVGYFTYLYTTGNRSDMLLTGHVDSDLTFLINRISLQHPSIAQLMNILKLGQTSQVLIAKGVTT